MHIVEAITCIIDITCITDAAQSKLNYIVYF